MCSKIDKNNDSNINIDLTWDKCWCYVAVPANIRVYASR